MFFLKLFLNCNALKINVIDFKVFCDIFKTNCVSQLARCEAIEFSSALPCTPVVWRKESRYLSHYETEVSNTHEKANRLIDSPTFLFAPNMVVHFNIHRAGSPITPNAICPLATTHRAEGQKFKTTPKSIILHSYIK